MSAARGGTGAEAAGTRGGGLAAPGADTRGDGLAAPGAGRSTVLVEVEQPLGPGLDFERDAHGQLIARRARAGGPWFGVDRAALVESDDGSGRALPVLVAVPVSTHAGARIEAVLVGGWQDGARATLVAAVEGASVPVRPVLAAAARVGPGATWIEADEAERIARAAQLRHRERRSHARIVGGRAWDAPPGAPIELARFTTPHSAAEYRLARLPPRFVRGLEDLLDDDERLLHWVERPPVLEAGLLDRIRGLDRRAALLALTDRQLLWVVDHAQPDQYLSDWGVDVELIPVERLLATEVGEVDGQLELAVTSPAGERRYRLPVELRPEVEVLRALAGRFAPAEGSSRPRRIYELERIPFDEEAAARFGQAREARELLGALPADPDVLAVAYNPRRPGVAEPAALCVRRDAIELVERRRTVRVELADVAALAITLSPLIARMMVIGRELRIEVAFPGPFADRVAAVVRLARRALANP